MSEVENLEIGDHVFATKYSDGDPADGWAVGFYDGILPKNVGNRFMVVDENGKQFRGNGFRRIAKIQSEEAANNIIKYCKQFDHHILHDKENLLDKVNSLINNQLLEIVISDDIENCKLCGSKARYGAAIKDGNSFYVVCTGELAKDCPMADDDFLTQDEWNILNTIDY